MEKETQYCQGYCREGLNKDPNKTCGEDCRNLNTDWISEICKNALSGNLAVPKSWKLGFRKAKNKT